MRVARAADRSIDAGPVAIVHDYLTQRGGAERVVLAMARAFPGAPIITSVYDPDGTFPEYSVLDVREIARASAPILRHDHRLGLPIYQRLFRSWEVRADLVLCSSSAWAHGIRTPGRKVVYCNNPPRWLYQRDEYLGDRPPRSQLLAAQVLAPLLGPADRRAALTADHYVANSEVVRERVRAHYGIDASVLHPPPAMTPDGPIEAVAGTAPGHDLVVSRLLPYKNVDIVLEAYRRRPERRVVVVGDGPERERLVAAAPSNVTVLGRVDDPELRALYASCRLLVCPSFEDFGLTPLEAASFGQPTLALRAGGYLETVVEGTTGEFFDRPDADSLLRGLERVERGAWDATAIRRHAEAFSESRFVDRLRQEARP